MPLDELKDVVNVNTAYESVIVTIPDETRVFDDIRRCLTVDRQYYKVSDCPVSVLLEDDFIENFVRRGSLCCISIGRCCVIDNCFSITQDGVLALHVNEPTYQCLGLQGKRASHNSYEIRIALRDKLHPRVKESVKKLETFDLNMSWEPHDASLCPSSLAKYLFDADISVAVRDPKVKHLDSASITRIPSIWHTEPSEVLEWLGMVWHGCDLTPEHPYVSTYTVPQSEADVPSQRIAMTQGTGCFSPGVLQRVCQLLAEHTQSRDIAHYWSALTMHAYKDSIDGEHTYQCHDSSITIFISRDGSIVYSAGLLYY